MEQADRKSLRQETVKAAPHKSLPMPFAAFKDMNERYGEIGTPIGSNGATDALSGPGREKPAGSTICSPET